MIYLDNAATTFPKPTEVTSEVLRCIEEYCGNPGRGGHRLAVAAAEKIYECREKVSSFFGLDTPENVFFSLNATSAVNTVIKGAVRPGCHVLISDMEHNAVYRPVFKLKKDRIVDFDVFGTRGDVAANFEKLIRKNTTLAVCTHIPNISSREIEIAKIGEICRKRGITFVVDASQSAGHITVDINSINADAVCFPGHKGLYGIQGCGGVCLRQGVRLDTLIEGGNGVNSLDGNMPDFSPERFEAGTLPTPAIVALSKGIDEIQKIGVGEICRRERELFRYCLEKLSAVGGVTVYEAEFAGPVLLFNIDGLPSDIVAAELARKNICVRGGYHCAALGHKTLGTPRGGAVRISFGIFNTEKEIDETVDVILSIAKNK